MHTDEMPAEHFQDDTTLETVNSQLVTQAHYADEDPAYYRSKLFQFDTGINPLISAADPLLAVATKLMANYHTPDIEKLQADLIHEIKAFETNAQRHHYSPQIILAARYILCTFLDETIIHSHWGKNVDWVSLSLLHRFHQEASGNVRFFIIMERSSEAVHSNIDLMELIFICLRLGYEGKYRTREKGLAELTAITDELYNQIREHRGTFSKKILIEEKNGNAFIHRNKLPSLNLLLALLILLVVVIRVDLTSLVKNDVASLNNALTTVEAGAIHP